METILCVLQRNTEIITVSFRMFAMYTNIKRLSTFSFHLILMKFSYKVVLISVQLHFRNRRTKAQDF